MTEGGRETASRGKGSLDRAIAELHDELHRIAEGLFRKEKPGHSLEASAVLNEAYLRLVDQRNLDPRDRPRLLAAAAKIMRRFLVDYARGKGTAKRPPKERRVSLDGSALGFAKPVDVLEVDDALEALAAKSARAAAVVELRFFAGRTMEEIAEALGVSPRTVAADWNFAKVWLLKALRT